MSRPARGIALSIALAVALVASVLLSSVVGQLPITPAEIAGSVLRALGIDTGWAPADRIVESTIWIVR